MPRIARKYINSKFIHIVSKGIKNEFIFYKEKYKQEYKNLLKKYLKEIEEIKLISYCIMDNHVHILIYTENIEKLSDLMKKLNTSYALYYNNQENRAGYVFANRYYTQMIENEVHLNFCTKYIHENPVKAGIVKIPSEYKYSSYMEIENKKINIEILDNIDYEKYKFIDVEENKSITDINLEKIIEEFCVKYKISLNEIKKSNYLIIKFKNYLNEFHRVSNKNICAILGIGKNRITEIEKRLKKTEK